MTYFTQKKRMQKHFGSGKDVRGSLKGRQRVFVKYTWCNFPYAPSKCIVSAGVRGSVSAEATDKLTLLASSLADSPAFRIGSTLYSAADFTPLPSVWRSGINGNRGANTR